MQHPTQRSRFRVLTVFGASVLFALLADSAQAQSPLSFRTENFTLQFDAAGRPASFKTADGDEWLNAGDPGLGFYLASRDDVPLRFERLEVAAGTLIASCIDGLPRVTLRVHEHDDYLAFHIERLEAVPASREFSMHFEMNLLHPVSLLELDYMTEIRTGAGPANESAEVRVDWHHTWHRDPASPKGGFALYTPTGPDDEDETILKIWVEEGLPHPRVDGVWDLAAARAWIDRWLELYHDQSRFWMSARTPEDLYAIVPYAERAGVRDVYLFTDTWRGGDREVFWTVEQRNWGINPDVFPGGEADLRAFSDYLQERGMHLKLHWISGGIGLRDPEYVGKSPDPQLASWGNGRLVGEVAARERTLHFRPDPGVEMPFRLPAADWPFRYTCPPAMHNIFDYEFMVVGDELIRVGAFEDTDQEVWRLENCQRGFSSTDPAEHGDGEGVRGLVSAYGQQLLPDNDSPLLDEMARNFAGMLNRCGIANTEYDGAEIHTYNGRMWGYHKFASLVYSHLDHPVTAYSSSGIAPPCHLEYRLNATANTWRERQKGIIALLLDQPFRPASTVLDAHWGMSQVCAHGYTMYSIMKPEPLFGIDIATLQAHGQTEALLTVARDWKRVSEIITPEQREQIRGSLYYADDVGQQAGKHEKSGVVHVLEKGPGQWEIYPTRVLVRPGKADTVWSDGQEHGAISPRQFMKPGETQRLVNPFAGQAPQIILRVLWQLDYLGKREQAAAGTGADARGADKDFEYAKTFAGREADANAGNVLLQPDPAELRNLRDTRATAEDGALVLEAANLLDRSVVNEDHLPEWSRTLNMIRRRGIGMWVTGDGSNAVMTLQIPGGDYVLPLDFTGRRYVEIPNAQVAWSTGYWGWRMGSKRSYYDAVTWLKIGFGLLPPQTSARVMVEGITALQETATQLENPVFHAGNTKLAVAGAIASGQYLVWDGGANARVYDPNWNLVTELPVSATDFSTPTGEFDFRVEGEGGAPWLELQVLTRDVPIVVPDPGLD